MLNSLEKNGTNLMIDYSLSNLGTFKIEKPEELKKVKHNDLEDMVYRMQLIYDEVMDKKDIKYFPSKKTSYTLPPAKIEISDSKKRLQFLLPDFVKVSFRVDNIR